MSARRKIRFISWKMAGRRVGKDISTVNGLAWRFLFFIFFLIKDQACKGTYAWVVQFY
jgi:hypothetical protein